MFKKLKSIKEFTILLLPDGTSEKTISLKLTSKRVIFWFLIYTLLVFLLGFYIISFTPVKHVLLPSSATLTSADMEKVEELNERVVFLVREIEKLKSSNEKLKYAIMLGDSTLIDSVEREKLKDSLSSDIKIEGNILKIFLKVFNDLFPSFQKPDFFISPVSGYISRGFDTKNSHYGLDYALKNNTPVYASAGGYVVFADYTIDAGYKIILSHPDNYLTIYQHCSLLLKKEKEFVEQGEIIALSGNSGKLTTGPHLHFEIWKDGIPVNPNEILINY